MRRRPGAALRSLGGAALVGLLTTPLVACAPAPEPPPNILIILVDTLRFDHLSFYGYERATSPEIERRLARRGVVVEEAYAQSTWTIPSVASLLTGLPPDAMLGERGDPVGIPEALTTLAERLAEIGWETAAFIGNPTVYAGNGFAQGFEAFYAPPRGSSMRRHADEVNHHALAWLRERSPGPFFLYLHYLDPHDPYDSPDVGERSPFYPDYTGKLRGTNIHALFLGVIELEDREADLAHLVGLYDSEIRYVDRHVAEILDAIPDAELANTLIVFTADHGEELLDHGSWKHGPTLYEEAIHVPLVVRWDRRLPAGRRVSGTVRLLDLVPTLMAAVGAPLDPEATPGVDLLPSLADGEPIPRLPAFSQKLGGAAPLRAAMIDGSRKLILFNRHHVPFTPRDPREGALWRRDVDRLGRVELYDLATDPQERSNLADGEGAPADLASGPLLRLLDRRLQGLRVMASGLAEGATLRGTLRIEPEPNRVTPLFLGPEDDFAVEGSSLSFTLHGDGLEKGLLVEGDVRSIASWQIELDGEALAPRLPRPGHPQPPLSAAELTSSRYLPALDGPELSLWIRRPLSTPQAEPAEETLQRLRELGYLE